MNEEATTKHAHTCILKLYGNFSDRKQLITKYTFTKKSKETKWKKKKIIEMIVMPLSAFVLKLKIETKNRKTKHAAAKKKRM